MNEKLSNDEYDALQQIAEAKWSGKPNACVARNVKRLSGLKFAAYGKNSALQITEKGTQTLFLRSCIDAMRALLNTPNAVFAPDVQIFLAKKGHIVPSPDGNGMVLTKRGIETLDDIDQTSMR